MKILLVLLIISSCVAKPLHREGTYCYVKQANFDCNLFNRVKI